MSRAPSAHNTPNLGQRKVIETLKGNIAVNAGAGTGKTRALTERFVNALSTDPTLMPGNILAITFTKAAAHELRGRVQNALRTAAENDALSTGQKNSLLEHARTMDQAWIFTFHAFCTRIIRAHAYDLDIDPAFAQLDETEATVLCEEVFDSFFERIESKNRLRAHSFDIESVQQYDTVQLEDLLAHASEAELYEALLWRKHSPASIRKKVTELIRSCSTYGKTPDHLESQPWEYAVDEQHKGHILQAKITIELVRRFFVSYRAEKRRRGVLDFTDLIVYTKQLLETQPVVAQRYRQRFKLIMIDEFQDTSPALLDIITPLSDNNLCIVGDVKQAIYGFNGADATLITDMVAQWDEDKTASVVNLDINYRSQPEIIQYVNVMCSHDALLGSTMQPLVPHKDRAEDKAESHAASSLDLSHRIHMTAVTCGNNRASTAKQEAALIAEHLHTLHNTGTPLSDMVVLVRRNADAETVLAALEARGLEAIIEGGQGFYRELVVRETLALMRLVRNPHDDEAFLTIALSPVGNLSDTTLDQLGAFARKMDDSDTSSSRCSLYDAAQRIEIADTAAAVNLAHFLNVLDYACIRRATRSAREIVDTVYRDRGVFDWWDQQPGRGVRDYANFRKLGRLFDAWSVQNDSFVKILDTLTHLCETSTKESLGRWLTSAPTAVTILTVHASKGREFPVVACLSARQSAKTPGKEFVFLNSCQPLHRRDVERAIAPLPGKRQAAAQEQWARQSKDALVYVVGDGAKQPRNALRDAFKTAQQYRDFAETKRLFYVACTRAEQRLFITYTAPENPSDTDSLGQTLAAIVDEITTASGQHTQDLAELVVFSAVPADASSCLPEQPVTGKTAPSRLPLQVLEPPVASVPPARQLVQISASQILVHAQCAWKYWWIERNRLGTLQITDDTPAIQGTVVHMLLEQAGNDPDHQISDVRARAIMQAHRLPEQYHQDVWRATRSYLDSPLHTRLYRWGEVRHEHQFYTPIDIAPPSGEATSRRYYLYGFMDAHALDARHRALVVDYKISASSQDKAHTYDKQAKVYALAALKHGATSVEIVFAQIDPTGMQEIYEYSAGVFTDTEALEREIAHDILRMQQQPVAPPADIDRALCATCPVSPALCPNQKATTRNC